MRKWAPLLFAVCLAVLSSSLVVAQTTKKLFEPVAITTSTVSWPFLSDGTTPTTPEDAVLFGTTQLFMSCKAGDTAYLSGDQFASGTLIVDNYIQVQTDTSANTTTENLCLNSPAGSCFSGAPVYPNPIPYLTKPAAAGYTPIADQQFAVTTGDALYTIRLMDWGFTYASTAVWLKTSCTIEDKVCHYDNGKGGKWKTLTIDPAGIAAHLKQHTNDHAGACTGTETVATN